MHELKKAIERILEQRVESVDGLEMISEEALNHLSEVYHAVKGKL